MFIVACSVQLPVLVIEGQHAIQQPPALANPDQASAFMRGLGTPLRSLDLYVQKLNQLCAPQTMAPLRLRIRVGSMGPVGSCSKNAMPCLTLKNHAPPVANCKTLLAAMVDQSSLRDSCMADLRYQLPTYEAEPGFTAGRRVYSDRSQYIPDYIHYPCLTPIDL